MATEQLSKVIGIRLPQTILDVYEAEHDRTSIPVATLVRRDLLRLFATEDATSGSGNSRENRPHSTHGQQPGPEVVKDGHPDEETSESALSAKKRRSAA